MRRLTRSLTVLFVTIVALGALLVSQAGVASASARLNLRSRATQAVLPALGTTTTDLGVWEVESSCSGSPCFATVTISKSKTVSQSEQEADPACAPEIYCVSTLSGGLYFYAEDVSISPGSSGSWTYNCKGCTGKEKITATFEGDAFTGTAESVNSEGNGNGETARYNGKLIGGPTGPEEAKVSGTVSDKVCGKDGCTQPGAGGVKVLVQGTTSEGAAESVTAVSASGSGAWSVTVPSGSYTAGPTQDGSSFGPAGVTPASQAVAVTTEPVTEVKGVNFTMPSYTVSGTVYGDECAETCKRSGLGGIEIALTGKARDGNAVDVTDESAENSGTWSAQVPAGSYEAAPDEDEEGDSGAPPGFEAVHRATGVFEVTDGDVNEVDFEGCAESPGASSGAAAASTAGASALGDRALTAGLSARTPSLRASVADTNAAVTLCQSVYRLKVTASLPDGAKVPIDPSTRQPYLVDPSGEARYNHNTNPADPDYRSANGAYSYVIHTTPILRKLFGVGREYPSCMSESQVHTLTEEGRNVEWYSYLSGASLGSYSVALKWNQSTQEAHFLEEPKFTHGVPVWRTFKWRYVTGSGLAGRGHANAHYDKGQCFEKENATLLALPIVEKNEFTIVTAWGFPFSPAGVTAADTHYVKHILNTTVDGASDLLRKAFGSAAGKELAKLYKELPERAKEGLDIAAAAAVLTGGVALVGLAPEALPTLVGAVNASDAAWAVSLGSILDEALAKEGYTSLVAAVEALRHGAHIAHHVHLAAEIVGLVNSFGGDYPVMSEIIRGRFVTQNPNGEVTPGGNKVPGVGRTTEATTLTLATKTTKFPNFGLEITREAKPVPNKKKQLPFSGQLSWSPQTVKSYTQPQVADSFESLESINQVSEGDWYASGSDALGSVKKQTKPIEGIKHSIEEGTLAAEYEQEESEVDSPPTCNPLAASTSLLPDTVCWVFHDGRA